MDSHSNHISKISKIFFLAASVCLVYQAMAYFSKPQVEATYSGKNHKLGASNSVDDYSSTFSGISCLIWGLVLQKAKNGMEVSSTKDSSTVSATVKKTGALICLIIGATAL